MAKSPIKVTRYRSEEKFKLVEKSLASLKGRRLGSGLFATVWACKNNKDRVIKIGYNDEGYETWVKAIGLDSKNPHFPKIYSYQKHIINSDDGEYKEMFVVEMERLKEYNSVGLKTRSKLFRELGCVDYGDERDLEGGNPYYFRPKTAHGKKLRRTLSRLWATDTHEGNVMFRKTGRGAYDVVVTDPLCL